MGAGGVGPARRHRPGATGPPGPASRAAMRIVPTASGSRPPASSASPSRSTSVAARRLERAVDRLDAVQPGVDVDVLGLGGDVRPQLRAAPLGEQLHAQRRAGGHRRGDRPDHDVHVGGPAAGAPPARGASAPSRRDGAAARPAARLRRLRLDRRQRRDDPHPQPRRQPRDVVQRLDDVGRAGRAGLVVRPVRHRDPPDVREVGEELRQVEDRGDRLAPARLADEREVPDREALVAV